MGGLASVLALQEQDSAIDRLQFKSDNLPDKFVLADIESNLERLGSLRTTAEGQIRELLKRQKSLEADASGLASRIESIDKQMYAGTITSPKDLQAMSHEIDTLKLRRTEIEDQILDLMEQAEVNATSVEEIKAEMNVAEASAATLKLSIDDQEKTLLEEMDKLKAGREEVATGIVPEMLSRYEAMRGKLDGVAVARLVNGACNGCHLTLPSTEVDRIKHAAGGTLFTCEQCGRILVYQ
ncbi:MAG TPA: C4-type zinc ribbon domain-containing protein [Acidimicrobiales bacterium]|nr:C4-type zinc ribbon domain-containing protein [Acidimicrobiales bacterium]